MTSFHAILLGITEWISEFLPISSTGHLILISKLLWLSQGTTHKTFEIAIQLGAILSVLLIYKDKLINIKLWKKLIIGFLPTWILGLMFYKTIKNLFDPQIVAYMLIIWWIIFILVETILKPKNDSISCPSSITYSQSFYLGLFQSISMIPGTSRSWATIIWGLLLGLNRKTATEFSFFLAIPTMLAATAYDTYKHLNEFTASDIQLIWIWCISSFIVAYFAIKTLVYFVSKYNFIPFWIYRIIIWIIFLALI